MISKTSTEFREFLEEKKNEKKPKTYIVMLLDDSGSMQRCRDAARNHFNEQIQTIKDSSKGQKIRTSFVKFNGQVNELFFNKKLKKLTELGPEDYTPRGSTALYDAMGLTMLKMEKELSDLDNKNVSVLFIVVSDGEENSSKEFGGETGRERIQEMIDKRQKTDRWTFTYMGANQDITKVAKSLGIHVGNATAFDTENFAAATQRGRGTLKSYMSRRSRGVKSVANYYSDGTDTKGKKPIKVVNK